MVYTITEFRKNHRKAFTEASQGKPVLITRHDETFMLVLEKPLITNGAKELEVTLSNHRYRSLK